MEIQQSISFSAQLKDDNEITFVNFNGSVDEFAVPSVSYYISNQETYRANSSLFRTSFMEFQNVVFDAADAKEAELAENTPEADVESGTDDAEVNAK